MTELNRETIVITGGASGIGEAVAHMCAARGARVVIADITERANSLAETLSGNSVYMDVTSTESVQDGVAFIEDRIGPVDALVTSAGITQRPLPPEDLDQSTWDDVMQVDLRGTWLCAREFGQRMAKRGRGSIVTIASVAGMRSMPLHAYTPAKAGVIAMSANLASEWGRSGVRVNSVAPGYTVTPLLKEQIAQGYRDSSNLEAASALGRMVEPDEVAEAVCFLASHAASAITGINVPVDAGWLAAPSWNTYSGLPPARE